jgi:hypothetical protein
LGRLLAYNPISLFLPVFLLKVCHLDEFEAALVRVISYFLAQF